MNHFNNGSIADMNMSYGYGYIILDTTVRDDEHVQVVQQRCNSNVIELVSMILTKE